MSGKGLEIYAQKKLVFVSPSVHRDGIPYSVYDTESIIMLDRIGQMKIEAVLEAFMDEFGCSYMDEDWKKQYIEYLERPDTILAAGQRHYGLKTLASSWYNRILEGRMTKDSQRYNKTQCRPEKPQKEVTDIWEWVEKTFAESRQNNRDNAAYDNKRPKKKIAHATNTIMSKHRFLTIEESKDILVYQNGGYVPYGEIVIEKEADALFGYDLASKDIAEITKYIMRKTYHSREELDTNLDLINTKNCLYNWVTDTRQDHTPDYLSINQINIIYNPEAKSEEYNKFLSEVLYPNEIQTATEMAAYTFYRGNPFDVLNFLHGSGSNGKSVYTGLITAAHGNRNISNVPLRELLEDPFAFSNLENKSANIDPEVSTSKPVDPTILKRLTGKQLTRINRKNKESYDALLYAKMFLSPNKIPQSSDDSDGYYRRNVIVTFPRKFEGKDEDPYKLETLSTEYELSSAFNVWMSALRNLMKNKGIFVNEKTIEERRKKYSRALDPLKAFMNERVLPYAKENDKEYKDKFYEAYKEYCEEFRLSYKSMNDFSTAIMEHPYYINGGRESKGDRLRYWKSVTILDKKQRELFDSQNEPDPLGEIPQESWTGRVD